MRFSSLTKNHALIASFAAIVAMLCTGLYSNSIHILHVQKTEGSAMALVASTNILYSGIQHSIHRLDRCQALKRHEEGRWQHHDLNLTSNINRLSSIGSSAGRYLYTPLEIDWLTGRERPQFYPCPYNQGKKIYTERGRMYLSKLGNQCGCGMRVFKPLHSVWAHHGNAESTGNSTVHAESNQDDKMILNSPSLQLIERLANANQTLCFMGDSIDYQF